MSSFAIAIPLVDGKTDAWVKWTQDMSGPAGESLRGVYTKHGIERTRCWLQKNPDGDVAIVLHEGRGASDWLASIGADESPEAAQFKQMAQEFHGIDVANPPPGMHVPELTADVRS